MKLFQGDGCAGASIPLIIRIPSRTMQNYKTNKKEKTHETTTRTTALSHIRIYSLTREKGNGRCRVTSPGRSLLAKGEGRKKEKEKSRLVVLLPSRSFINKKMKHGGEKRRTGDVSRPRRRGREKHSLHAYNTRESKEVLATEMDMLLAWR